jgi:hypothetical protein
MHLFIFILFYVVMGYWCRNVTGDWVWSSDEEDAEDDADKNKSKKMSKTPKEVPIAPFFRN